MVRIGQGGEEWREMELGSRPYDPTAYSAQLKAARENIERYRKRDFVLKLVDFQGQPVVGKQIKVLQERSAFAFGDGAWNLDTLYRTGQWEKDRGRYQKRRYLEVLNAVNALCYWTERPRNDGPKTEDFQGEPQYEGFAAVVDWGNANGLTVKGHPLAWSIPKCVPEWVKRYDYETQMKFLEVRIRSLVARFKGRVKLWDAVNEALWEASFRHLPERDWPHLETSAELADYIAPVLRWCREEDPDACYLLNDYGLEQDKADGKGIKTRDGTMVTAALQRQRFKALVEELRSRGTPPDALGMQAHTGGWLPHDAQWQVYDDLAETRLPLHVTEFWAHTTWLEEKGVPTEECKELQAEYVVNYLTCAFGHPALEAFFFWGCMGMAVPFGDPIRSGHDFSPAYERLRTLLHETWRTKETLTSGADGTVAFRGFLGDYTLRHALPDGRQTGQRFRADAATGTPLTVRLPLA